MVLLVISRDVYTTCNFKYTRDFHIYQNLPTYSSKILLRLILMYFIRFPSRWALERAKKNVEKYAVVGILEEYDDFIKVLEKLLPNFFKGAYQESKIPGNMSIFTMISILAILNALISAPRFIFDSEIYVVVD